MRFGAFVLFMMCVGIAMWFLNFTTPLSYVLGISSTDGQAYSPNGESAYGGKPFEVTGFLERIGQFFSNPSNMGTAIGLLVVTLGLSALTGFSSMYFIPVLLMLFVVNYVVLPVNSDLLAGSCANAAQPNDCVKSIGTGLPEVIYWPLMLIFNVITVMACLSFIRGGV
jgi:hypothetical protein